MRHVNRTTLATLFGVGTALVALGMVAACQAIDGVHVYSYDNPEASVIVIDGGVVVQDGGVKYTGFGDAQCALATPPSPPDPASVTSTAETEYVVAFSALSFTGNATSVIGYDLDGVCTGEPTEGGTGPSSCVSADGSTAPFDTMSEAGDGVDSVLSSGSGGLQAFFNGTDLDKLSNVESDIEAGTETGFFVIDGYNFTANDPQVTVSFGTAEPLQSTGCGDAEVKALPDGSLLDGGMLSPGFDGCDTWTVDEDSLVLFQPDGGGKLYRSISTSAYVSNGYLVARFRGSITFPIGDITLTPSYPLVVAKLNLATTDAGQQSISVTNGLIQGRLSATSFLFGLSSIGDPANPADKFCPGSPSYPFIHTAVCSHLDINGNGLDGVGAPCDSFTFAATFSGITAHLGAIVPGGSHPSGCPEADASCP
jgi:hypothetical protein